MPRRVEFLRSAAQQFEDLDREVQDRIGQCVDRLALDAFHPGTKSLKGYPGLRRSRVGDYRVVYVVSNDVVTIAKIGNRGEIYRHLERLARQLGR